LKESLVCDCTNLYPGAAFERRFAYENCWKSMIHQYKMASVNNAVVRLLQTVSPARENRDACETCNRYLQLLNPVTLLCFNFFSCASTFGPFRFLLCHKYFIIQNKNQCLHCDVDLKKILEATQSFIFLNGNPGNLLDCCWLIHGQLWNSARPKTN
jgi:hypothetical protein